MEPAYLDSLKHMLNYWRYEYDIRVRQMRLAEAKIEKLLEDIKEIQHESTCD